MIRLPLLAALLIAGCCLNCVPYMAKAPAVDSGPSLPMTVVPAATQTPTPTGTETPCLVKCPACIDQCAQIEGRPVPTR